MTIWTRYVKWLISEAYSADVKQFLKDSYYKG